MTIVYMYVTLQKGDVDDAHCPHLLEVERVIHNV